jgi:hypothetical protein
VGELLVFIFELKCFMICVVSGRPIVKGNANFQYAANVDYQQQQQHRHNAMISGGGNYNNSVPRSKITLTAPPPNMTPQFNSLMMMHRPSNVRGKSHLELFFIEYGRIFSEMSI